MQREHAFHAVPVFYEIKDRDLDKTVKLNNINQDISIKKLSKTEMRDVHKIMIPEK